jgi:hypothetical protein
MNPRMKFSVLHLSLWSFVGISFLYIFFSNASHETLSDNTTKTIMLAIFFLIGFLGDALLRFIYKKNKLFDINNKDNLYMQYKALSYSYIPLLIYMFIVSISLFLKYEKGGAVPVGWLWFMAYSIIVVANVLASAFSIYLYKREGSKPDL